MMQKFTKPERLRGQKSFQRLFQEGEKFQDTLATLYLLPNQEGINRVGLAVSRRLGKAVQRNRIKRLFREAYRLTKENLKGSFDLVFLIRAAAKEADFHTVLQAVQRLLRQAGLCQ